MEEGQLTKKERRALAKEEKRKVKLKENLTSKLRRLFYIIATAVVVIGGVYFLAKLSSRESEGAKEKFISYAQELGLNGDNFRSDLEGSSLDEAINSDIAEANNKGVNATPTFFLNGNQIDNPRSYDDFKALINGVILDSQNRINFELSEGDRVKGSTEAGIVLVEYSDFQCPACASYHPIVNRLNQDFPDELLVVYRHFPLTGIHPNAFLAAKASEAAANQGKFWQMHDMLFERQDEWADLR